jgi:hypothetical protein
MKKIEDADKSFARALKLDEDTGEAVVGRLRVKLRQGQLGEALAGLRKVEREFARDNVFEYHAGLLYADAVGTAAGNKDLAKARQGRKFPKPLVDRWKSEALSWISDAIRHGFNDSRLVRSSPELKPLEKHPRFEKALSGQLPERKLPQPKAKPDEAPAEGEAARENEAAAADSNQSVIIQVDGTVDEDPAIIQPVVIDLPPAPR